MENKKELIDRKKVYELACAGCTRHGDTAGECNSDEPCERLIFAFTVAEPVDAVEVVHGRWEYGKWEQGHWVKGNERCRCSVCHRDFAADHLNIWNGCPHCLAKMDGGNKDG